MTSTAQHPLPLRGPGAPLDAAHSLDAIPVRNVHARVNRDAFGQLIVRVPLQKRWFMAAPWRWILPLRTEHAIALDSLAEEVWDACDGMRSCEVIIDMVATKHRLRFSEARAAVLLFFKQLAARGALALVVTTPGAPPAAS